MKFFIVLSSFLDVIFVFAASYFIYMCIPSNVFIRENNVLILACILLPLIILYFTILPASLLRATIGQYLCGLEIVDKHNNRITYQSAFKRWLSHVRNFSWKDDPIYDENTDTKYGFRHNSRS